MEEVKKVKKPRGIAHLIPGKCIACGARCQSDCPEDAIEMNDKGEPIITAVKCIGCKRCVKICPAQALEMYFTPEEQKILDTMTDKAPEEAEVVEPGLKEYRGVWIFIEHTEGKPATVSWELLGEGAKLAKTLNVELCSVVIGENVEHLCQESFSYGASKVYLIDAPVFHHYRTETFFRGICYLVEKYKPEILLMGATGMGRDLAGAVATKLQTGLTADCTGLDIDEKGYLLQTRPAFGGNIMATIMTEKTRPQMSTVRPHVMELAKKDPSRIGAIVRESIDIREEELPTRVIEVIEDASGDQLDLAGAEIIVSGGRGMCGMENFSILQELADELGGSVGCSRAAVEAGWMPPERQVGQTGKTVRPKIYIACGISGAIQHLVGMQSSDLIIAINQDRNAPIFEVATYGIVGDVFQIVPAMTERIRELKSKKGGSPKNGSSNNGPSGKE
ncbi:MAG: FAD-binding protein [Candidatus Methanoperedens sp.]|nr:FAD-binding protein [Candidatus Methanoperedens sp.]